MKSHNRSSVGDSYYLDEFPCWPTQGLLINVITFLCTRGTAESAVSVTRGVLSRVAIMFVKVLDSHVLYCTLHGVGNMFAFGGSTRARQYNSTGKRCGRTW